MSNIRKALIQLHGLKISKFYGDGTRTSNMSLTISGASQNKKAQRVIAQKLNLPKDELFPEPFLDTEFY
jgi:hypothetical protein